jgi:hypothetical protein
VDKGGITPINHSGPGSRVRVNRHAPNSPKIRSVNPFLRSHNALRSPVTSPV